MSVPAYSSKSDPTGTKWQRVATKIESPRMCPVLNECLIVQPKMLVPNGEPLDFSPAMTAAKLKKFCATDIRWRSLMVPFSRGGDTYAADHAMCIRVPKLESVPHDPWNDGPQHQAVEALFAKQPVIKPADLIDLPELPLQPPYHERRRWYTPPSLIIGGKRIGLELLWKVATLRAVRLAPNLTGPMEPMQFVFQGGDGLIMPMQAEATFFTQTMIEGGELSASEKLFSELSKGPSPPTV